MPDEHAKEQQTITTGDVGNMPAGIVPNPDLKAPGGEPIGDARGVENLTPSPGSVAESKPAPVEPEPRIPDGLFGYVDCGPDSEKALKLLEVAVRNIFEAGTATNVVVTCKLRGKDVPPTWVVQTVKPGEPAK